jgi:HSP90 family molecular chaperone
VTRSMTSGAAALRWEPTGGPRYEITDSDKSDPGTDVTLHLKSDALGITNPDELRKSVQKYADFIPFPISVNGDGPVNTMQAPWHVGYATDAERRKAYKKWVEDRFPDFPLEVIPVDIEAPYPVKGVLYISDRNLPNVDTPGIVDIYQARMFIKEGDRKRYSG